MHKDILTPIQPNEIEWRIQSSKYGKTTLVPYITNRCVMTRFDAAFTPKGWTSEFREITNGFICRLTVTYDGVTIYREDGATKTDIEPEKGGISDSMKRAAVQFGLGRGLYDYPRIQIEGEYKYIPGWCYPKLNELVNWVNRGECTRDVVILKEGK